MTTVYKVGRVSFSNKTWLNMSLTNLGCCVFARVLVACIVPCWQLNLKVVLLFWCRPPSRV